MIIVREDIAGSQIEGVDAGACFSCLEQVHATSEDKQAMNWQSSS